MSRRYSMKLFLVLALSLATSGCHGMTANRSSVSGFKHIKDFATVECYYHNVAEIENDGTDYLFGLINVGYKHAWFEYNGKIRMGIDASKVKVQGPDSSGRVIVELPDAEVLSFAFVDENSFSELYTDKGIFTQVTLKDQRDAYKMAQEAMRNDAKSDTRMLREARERAEALIEQYIKTVGSVCGEDYTVEFR